MLAGWCIFSFLKPQSISGPLHIICMSRQVSFPGVLGFRIIGQHSGRSQPFQLGEQGTSGFVEDFVILFY